MESKFRQEMPRPGGYARFEWGKYIPKPKFSGYTAFAAFFGITGFGFYCYSWEMKYQKKWRLEMNDARIALEPLLLAERQRMYLTHLRKARDEEEEVMKNVPGWETGKYKGEPLYHNKDLFPVVHPEAYFALNHPNDLYDRMYIRRKH